MGSLLALALLAAGPDAFEACVAEAMAALSDPERAELTRGEPRPIDYDARQQQALLDPHDVVHALRSVLETAVEAGDRDRAVQLAELIEREAAAKPPKYEDDRPRRELELALVQALVGHRKEALAHVEAARPRLVELGHPYAASQHRELLIIALTLGDEPFAKAEETALREAIDRDPHPGYSNAAVQARFVAYAGFGRRVLELADRDPAERDHVLSTILEGVKSRKDVPLVVEILGRFGNARTQLLELEQAWISLSTAARRRPDFGAAIKRALDAERRPEVDDFARLQLIQVLADIGRTKEAASVSARILNPWMRANAEATVARALALTEPKAAVSLAHAALQRAKTKGARTSVDNDRMEIEAARSWAISALARAGAIDEAERLGKPSAADRVIGLRDQPKALAAWWMKAPALERARVLRFAQRGWLELNDLGFLVDVCSAPP